jgi:uncharacterized membrane protein HdeD (DUF308 family)
VDTGIVESDIVLFGISMAIAIPLLLEGFKSLGMPDSWKPWVGLILCVLASIASTLLNLFPGVQGPLYITIYTIVSALALWLIVTGIFQVARNVTAMSRQPPSPEPPKEPKE